jgi:HPt (histidine-containing phosphotransfer) domain-containing protein
VILFAVALGASLSAADSRLEEHLRELVAYNERKQAADLVEELNRELWALEHRGRAEE